jgi:DNA mismatch repair protein PMS2
VIVDLSSAVKELVENALDAHATTIEIRLKDHGLESIEVSGTSLSTHLVDNGTGISPLDYDHVASKHSTSKLVSFQDIYQIQSYGFRGEALSSLCALGSLSIMTSTLDQTPLGRRLEFNVMGQLTSQCPCAREKGLPMVYSCL